MAPSSLTVAVSFARDSAAASEDFRRLLATAAASVGEVLAEQGAEVRELNAAAPVAETEPLRGVSALVVLGGADIDPAHYRRPIEADNLYFIDSEVDRREIALVREAKRLGIPVLGICRGAQVINVALGGTLIQDLGSGLHNAEIVGEPFMDHDVEIVDGSLLATMLPTRRLIVRTAHHQAVAELGDGLAATAHATDGVVEAVEDREASIIGVQWHPEEGDGDRAALQDLFAGFLDIARRAAG